MNMSKGTAVTVAVWPAQMSPSSRMIWPLPASDVPRTRLPPNPTEPSRAEPPPEPVPPPVPPPVPVRAADGVERVVGVFTPAGEQKGGRCKNHRACAPRNLHGVPSPREQRTNCCKSMDWADPPRSCGLHVLNACITYRTPPTVALDREIFKVYGRNAGSRIKFPTRRMATPNRHRVRQTGQPEVRRKRIA